MRKSFVTIALGAMTISAGTVVTAQPLTLPTADEAKAAVIVMFGDPDLAGALKAGHVKLGTCKKPGKPEHEGEIACTIAVAMGAGSSETQANFYRAGGKWVATPTKEDLPFPDPKLR